MRHPARRQASAFTRPAAAAVVPIERQTVTSMTRDALRERILRGTYAAGEPLRQDAIAEQLGVSRIPVREALRLLEAEGLVTFNPHRGAIVSSLSIAEIEELFELRADIEGDLIHRAVPHMTAEHFAAIQDVLDAFEAALRSENVAGWGGLNWQFHSMLYAPANRPVTMGVVQKLHQHSDRYSRMQLALTHGQARAHAEHCAIVRAARRHDVRSAESLLRKHIQGAGRALVEFLRAQQADAASPRRARHA